MTEKRLKRLVLILLLIMLFLVAVVIWALFLRSGETIVLSPDRVPPAEEKAEQIPDDTTEKSEVPADGGAVNLTFSTDVTIDRNKKNVALYFANPNKSSHNIVLQIVVRDAVIVQSGTIEPGNQVVELELMEGADKQFTQGGYDGKFIVLYYDRTNGKKEPINAEIPVKITVK